MKKVLKAVLGILFLVIILGTFATLWNKSRPKPAVYTILSPTMDTIVDYVTATGRLEPRDEILIKPQVSGIVSHIYCRAGERLNSGDVIARIKVIPDMGVLNSAQTQVSMAELNLEQCRKEYERTEKLYDKQVVSQEEYEKNKTAYLKASEELQSAKDHLDIVQNGIASRNTGISNTQIRTTITGVILDIPVKVGSSVIMANTFNEGTTIASIADINRMIFQGKVDETDVGKLSEGMPVEITIAAFQDKKLTAILEYIAPKGIEENGVILFDIKAAMVIPEEIIVRAGYSANANIITARHENILTVPESTIEFDNNRACVYLLKSSEEATEQLFEKREVQLGVSNGINVEILEGLQQSDRLRGQKKDVEHL